MSGGPPKTFTETVSVFPSSASVGHDISRTVQGGSHEPQGSRFTSAEAEALAPCRSVTVTVILYEPGGTFAKSHLTSAPSPRILPAVTSYLYSSSPSSVSDALVVTYS